MTPRYLSGIQPSGDLHLGNYFGAIRQHASRCDNAYYFLANYHAQTTVADADTLRRNTQHAAATCLALGLDPTQATLFRQSDVPEVTELAWLLGTAANKGLLDRAVSFKDKVAQGIVPSFGLYHYPILMAADILLYETDVVPVGSDQVQHVEMCRDMALAFNRRAEQEVFKLPTWELGTPVPVPGVDGRKMSKSYGNTIPLFSTGEPLRDAVMRIVTHTLPLAAPKDPEACTVFQLYALLATHEERETMAARYHEGGYGYGHAKLALLARIEETFADPRHRYTELVARPDLVDDVLQWGAGRARSVARRVLERARVASGVA